MDVSHSNEIHYPITQPLVSGAPPDSVMYLPSGASYHANSKPGFDFRTNLSVVGFSLIPPYRLGRAVEGPVVVIQTRQTPLIDGEKLTAPAITTLFAPPC